MTVAGEAFVSVTPTGGIDASTFGAGTMEIRNDAAAGGPRITSVTLNLATALFPDIVFDPVGAAGDATAKCFTADGGAAATGYVAPVDPCVDPFSIPHDGGYDEVVLTFTDFDPGESFTFSVDIDPTSIQTAGGSGGAGSVSGLELTGSRVTVEFDSLETFQTTLFRTPASDSGGEAIVRSGGPAAPSISVLGVAPTPATVSDASQTVRVTALEGSDVRLLVVEGAMDLGGAPGFDLDPFEANTAILIGEQSGTVDAGGFIDFPVTLTRSTPEGGLNHLVAVVVDGDGSGRVSAASPVLVLELQPPATINFSSSSLAGEALNNPTSLDFGPDGRLYVAQQNGLVLAYTIARVAPDDYQVTATETISLVKDIPNRDDDGTLNLGVTNRQVTGLLAAGTAANPELYVTSSDPRIGAGSGGNDLDLDTNSGTISRLTWTGSIWDKLDLVRGLPRSEENHSTNGMALDEASGTLYVVSGGNTNKGAPSNNFAQTLEYALSAAMLSVDLAAIEALPTQVDAQGQSYKYDLPTLDDPTRPGNPDPGDPFGGNDGRNQAIIRAGEPVQVYSPGFRNAYDVVLTEAGRIYSVDNGPNSGWGGLPIGEGTSACTNETNEAGSTGYGDGLHFVSGPGYYAGHPHPTRGNPETSGLFIYENIGGTWTLTEQYDWQIDFPEPPVPLGTGNAAECDYLVPGGEDGALAVINASTNGITEYTATNFGGAMQGDLLAASYNGNVYRFQLTTAGDALEQPAEVLFTGFGAQPLDVVTRADADSFPGTVWVAVYGSDSIAIFEPVDFTSCAGTDDPAFDEDGDGFDNADEIDNGTDPCSGGSRPSDNDGDFVSDLNDSDDDNDGLLDLDDPFAIDPDNGTTTDLPVRYPFFNADPGTGFFGLGFTGLMKNGATDYLDQYDETTLAAGGAAGLFTVEQVTEGDALNALDSQDNGFQLGVNVDTASTVFSAHTRLLSPYFEVGGSASVPIDFQSYGLYVGTGDQGDYVKVVLNAQGGAGGIEVVSEQAGVATATDYDTTVVGDVLGSITLDLFLTVDPAALTVQPHVAVDDGPILDLGAPIAIPAAWLAPADGLGLAVGVISTARGSAVSYGATWDFIDVTPGAAGIECLADADCDDGDVCTIDSCGGGQCQNLPGPSGVPCEADGDLCSIDECNGLGACVNVGPVTCPQFEVCDPQTGACVPDNVDSDNDGILDAQDPCVDDPRNLCYGPVAQDALTGADIRINASTGQGCSGVRVDCNGDTWEADFGFNQGNSFSCNLANGCPIAGLDAIFGAGCDGNVATEDIFRCERWDDAAAPELLYSFDVPDGRYLVNLLFAEAWNGAVSPGQRVFDVVVEGALVFDDFDQVVAAGSAGTAVIRSAEIDVTDGNGLQIELLHGVQNPSLKGIEVLSESACSAGGPPSGPATMALAAVPAATELSWGAVADAEAYDVVRGDLDALLGSAGDFSAAGTQCLADDLAATLLTDADLPAAGAGYWYALRPVNCAGTGSYDSGGGGQVSGRDAGIGAAPGACP